MTDEQENTAAQSERDAHIVAMRDAGASWNDIERAFGLTRQQARYGYQRGKRIQRRLEKRKGNKD